MARASFCAWARAFRSASAAALRSAAEACGRDVGLLGDLQGPKIRIKRFENGSVHLDDGAPFFLDSALGLTDGKRIWSYETGRPITSSPAVADGMVIVGCDDGMVYCFK